MFKNYFKVAFRNLIRNKLYAIISVIGLSIGITCCLMIYLYVQQELSFDTFHANRDYLYRMIRSESETGELGGGTESNSPLLFGELKANFPEIKYATRLVGSKETVSYRDKSFNHLIVNVDPDFFSMFSFPLIQGDKETVLEDVKSLVLTDEMAEKYFSEEDPVGKILSVNISGSPHDFIVSGIVEKAPKNSSIQYDFLIHTDAMKYVYPPEHLNTWNMIFVSTFIQLSKNVDVAAFVNKVSEHVYNIAFENDEDAYEILYKAQPLTDIHLNTSYSGEMVAGVNPLHVFILSTIAFAVLLIACINFTTLAIGRSHRRSREVGLRKVLGAQRFHVMKQFWGEALLLSVLSLLIGLILVEILLPVFNELAQKELTLNLFSNWHIILALTALVLITSFLAGFYPSVMLSKLQPLESIRGAYKPGGKNRLTQALVIMQFTISTLLIIGTMIISSQINYVNEAELGFDKNYVVTFRTGTEGQDASNLLERFRTELIGRPSIVDITGYTYSFSGSWLYVNKSEEGTTILIGEDLTGPGYPEGADKSSTYFYVNWVDPHYLNAMDIKLLEGRNFSEEHLSDSNSAILINQTAAEIMGLENPVGGKLPRGFDNAVIIGVVEDFHFYPLHREIEPLVLHLPRHDEFGYIREIAVRIRANNIAGTLAMIENTWDMISDGKPFEYSFLDDKINEQYAQEMRWKRIVQYSSLFSVLITCLGLFGLTSLAVVKRTKEIAIRKVLGASTQNILRALTKEFIILVIIANIISWPVAYYAMNKWLEGFAYRTSVGIATFILAGISALFIALITVSYQAIKAARANPVKALQQE